MKFSYVAPCEYPTTVTLVDDNISFLDNLSKLLKQKGIACAVFSNPEKVLPSIAENASLNQYIQKCSKSIVDADYEGEESHDHPVNINMLPLHQLVYEKNRLQERVVVVIDYSMQPINGDELAKELRAHHPHLKIIMLTGEADFEMATEFYNQGLINKFFQKSDAALFEKLEKAIHALQREYFLEKFDALAAMLTQNRHCMLRQPDFIKYFYETCRAKQIVEYYLLDGKGSFLLLDENAKAYLLIAKSVQDMEEDVIWAEDEDAPEDVLNGLREGRQLLFFISNEDRQRLENWHDYTFLVTRHSPMNEACYALIEGVAEYPFDLSKVTSYQQFLHA